MFDKPDTTLRFQQEALDLRAQCQEMLATNIANVDTPSYQVRDIGFTSEFRGVMQRGRDATSVVTPMMTPTQHTPAQALALPIAELQYRISDQPSLDGNTVDMDRKHTQLADNGLQYQVNLSALSGQIKNTMNVLQSGNQRTALLNIFDIAGSVLAAQSQHLNVAISNLVSAGSVIDPDGQPYRTKQMVPQVSVAPGAAIGGVEVADVIESQISGRLVYESDSLLVDVKGYVKTSNADVVGEMVNTMSAPRSYQANVEVLNMMESAMLKTLTLGQ